MVICGRIHLLRNVTSKQLFQRRQLVQFVRKMSMVEFDSKNKKGKCPGYLQGSDFKTTKGLIVLQEWWGLNDQIKDEAKHIGDLGNFMTITPDLYRGELATDSEQAGHLMSNLDWTGAVQDIEGAAKYLLSKGCKKVGVTGFCMGGALSLGVACGDTEISATAPFYGVPSAQYFDLSTIKIPVQAHFGAVDALEGFSSPKEAFGLMEKLKQNTNFELIMYGGCGHAFTNPTGPLGNYNKEACEQALKRMVEFMDKYLSD